VSNFIYQPNKSLSEIRELNSKRGKQKEPVNKLLELAEGELRSPMHIRNKIIKQPYSLP